MGAPAFVETAGDTLLIKVKIHAGASKTCVTGELDGRLKIDIAAPAVDGKANAALLSFLAKKIGCAKNALAIKSGVRSKLKTLAVGAEYGAAVNALGG